MNEYYRKEYTRGGLETWNRYINDVENEDGLSIKSGSTIDGSNSTDISEAYAEMKNILAINKESRNSRLLARRRCFNSTISKISPLSKSKYSHYTLKNLSNPECKNSKNIGNFLELKQVNDYQRIEDGYLIIKPIKIFTKVSYANNHSECNIRIFVFIYFINFN